MATVTGVVDFYVADDYIVDQGDYNLGPARIVTTVTATGEIVVPTANTLFGGAVIWQDCPSWANWPENKWAPGINPALAITSAGTPSITRGSGTLDPQLTLTTATVGSAIFGPTVASNIVTTALAQGNAIFSSSASADTVFTVSAEGGKLLHGVASGDLVVTVVAVGERQPGGTANAQLTFTTDATGVVRLTGEASAELVITASGRGQLTFLGNATANLVLTTTLTGGLVQKPSQPATTYAVPSETRIYTLGLDSARTFTILNGETRVYKVLHDTRVATVPSETRIQPTEVY